MWDQGMWMTSCSEAWAEHFGLVCWVPASERESCDSDLGESGRICALRALRVGWVESWRCKSSQHRKIVSLSPHVENPLNSKRWIKVSCLNQFRVFGFLYMFMNILWTFCLFHISVSWVFYKKVYWFKETQPNKIFRSLFKRQWNTFFEISVALVFCQLLNACSSQAIIITDHMRKKVIWH